MLEPRYETYVSYFVIEEYAVNILEAGEYMFDKCYCNARSENRQALYTKRTATKCDSLRNILNVRSQEAVCLKSSIPPRDSKAY
jgi:hypothetical protein